MLNLTIRLSGCARARIHEQCTWPLIKAFQAYAPRNRTKVTLCAPVGIQERVRHPSIFCVLGYIIPVYPSIFEFLRKLIITIRNISD